MARPISNGVQYFPLDVGFFRDRKLRVMRAEFGSRGVEAFLGLLCVLYETQGYFMVWDKVARLLFAEDMGYAPGFVEEWTRGCVKCGLFDERVFNVFQVLTSHGIQRRYLLAKRNSSAIYLHKDLLLVDLNDTENVPAGVRGKIFLKKSFLDENPDYLDENQDYLDENAHKEKKRKIKEISPYGDKSAVKPAAPVAETQEIVDLYNDICRSFPQVRVLTDGRRKAISARIRAQGADAIREVFAKAEASAFLKGANDRGWRASFDWIIQKKNFIKILEGNYDGGKKGQAPPSYDLDAVMKAAEELDPTKTKRGDV